MITFAAQNNMNMSASTIIGRQYEVHLLEQIEKRKEPQLVAIYGRRRVGKTFLVKKFFDEKFDFAFTGSYQTTTPIQLTLFAQALAEYSCTPPQRFKTWFEAFTALKDYLKTLKKKKIVVFLDEIPWMDNQKSNFLAAFSQFWNAWASTANGMKVIVCGSATTWMLDKFVGDKGGFYGRNNRAIYLAPFTLGETQKYMKHRGIQWARPQIAETYMILGGIPYYLDMLDPTLPLVINIDRLFYAQGAPLKAEYDFLFRTLFKEATLYRNIVETIAKKVKGVTRAEIKEALKLKEGGELTTALKNLQKCDFIRMYSAYGKKEREMMYQLTDLYTLYYLRFIKAGNSQDEHYWSNIDDHSHDTWAGYAFEMLCMHHITQIKQKLGINGILTNACSWQTKPLIDKDGTSWKGTQIDLLLERADHTINVCEMKYSKGEYVITESYDRHLHERIDTFRHHTGTTDALPVVFVTSFGLKKNTYSSNYHLEVTINDLFE